MSFADVDFAMFWDVASLYQTDRVRGTDDRSDAEKALFKSALAKGGALNLWYGHYFTAVWIQSELPDGFEAKMSALGLARTYSESGWCHVESSMASLIKSKDKRLDLSLRTTHNSEYDHVAVFGEYDHNHFDYNNLVHRCAVGRAPPLTPQAMSLVVHREKKFTGNADCNVVDDMYRDFFEATAPTVIHLSLKDIGWGPAEASALADALPHFPNCLSLDLFSNPICDAGAEALFDAIARQGACSLQTVKMVKCSLGDGAALALARVLERNRSLTFVSLAGNPSGQTGLLTPT